MAQAPRRERPFMEILHTDRSYLSVGIINKKRIPAMERMRRLILHWGSILVWSALITNDDDSSAELTDVDVKDMKALLFLVDNLAAILSIDDDHKSSSCIRMTEMRSGARPIMILSISRVSHRSDLPYIPGLTYFFLPPNPWLLMAALGTIRLRRPRWYTSTHPSKGEKKYRNIVLRPPTVVNGVHTMLGPWRLQMHKTGREMAVTDEERDQYFRDQ